MKSIEAKSDPALSDGAGTPVAMTEAESSDRAAVEITGLLSRMNQGAREAFDQMIPRVYHELHRIAEGYARRESCGKSC